jgi:hypothetical protein
VCLRECALMGRPINSWQTEREASIKERFPPRRRHL